MVKYPDLSKMRDGTIKLKANSMRHRNTSVPAGGSFHYPARYRVIFETGEPRFVHVDSVEEGKRLLSGKGGLIFDNQSRQVLFETEKRYMNPPDDFEVDAILNENEAIGRNPQRLWLFQFGSVGTTYIAVWDGYNGGLEGSLETAAEWLAENAPGHITSEEEMNELYAEAAEELGLSWPIVDEWSGQIDWDDERVQKVTEKAEADMTRTESGWLTSYEWYVDELEPGSEQYNAIFEETIDSLEDLDEDDIERANEIAEKIGLDAEWEADED